MPVRRRAPAGGAAVPDQNPIQGENGFTGQARRGQPVWLVPATGHPGMADPTTYGEWPAAGALRDAGAGAPPESGYGAMHTVRPPLPGADGRRGGRVRRDAGNRRPAGRRTQASGPRRNDKEDRHKFPRYKRELARRRKPHLW